MKISTKKKVGIEVPMALAKKSRRRKHKRSASYLSLPSCSLFPITQTIFFYKMAYTSMLQVEALGSSKTFLNIYQTTCHNMSEDSNLHSSQSTNRKSHNIFFYLIIQLI
jgi:hypothetical protein